MRSGFMALKLSSRIMIAVSVVLVLGVSVASFMGDRVANAVGVDTVIFNDEGLQFLREQFNEARGLHPNDKDEFKKFVEDSWGSGLGYRDSPFNQGSFYSYADQAELPWLDWAGLDDWWPVFQKDSWWTVPYLGMQNNRPPNIGVEESAVLVVIEASYYLDHATAHIHLLPVCTAHWSDESQDISSVESVTCVKEVPVYSGKNAGVHLLLFTLDADPGSRSLSLTGLERVDSQMQSLPMIEELEQEVGLIRTEFKELLVFDPPPVSAT